jgi:Tol biopolymer transport system component
VLASTRPGGSGGYDLYLFDLTTRLFIPLPNINTVKDERKPSISADGSVIVFQSTRTGGLGKTDIWNYDRLSGSVGQALGESSVADDLDPCVLWR